MLKRGSFPPGAAAMRALRPGAPKLSRFAIHQNSNIVKQFSASTCYRKEEKPSFKGQLYESTHQRLLRERAEQERFAQYQARSPGPRYVALTVGESRLSYNHASIMRKPRQTADNIQYWSS